MPNILIVGGYGTVGSKIAGHLDEHRPDATVVIAGRNLEKAKAAAAKSGFEAQAIDLERPESWDAALSDIDVVVTCIDQTDTAFVEAVAERNIAYIDVTAGDDFFRKVEKLQSSKPVILSVGLAPGLSNLLAVAASAEMEQISTIEIGLLMGTGDDHGSAAIAWSTAQMFDAEAPHDDAIVDFGPDFGRRKAYFMDFADQHALARTLGSVRTVTRVTYDSAILTSILFWIGRRFAGNRRMEALVNRISHMPTLGSDKCVLSVTASGISAGKPVSRKALFLGRLEATVTAAMAAAMVEEVLDGRAPAGVNHAHQFVDPIDVLGRMEKWGQGRLILGPLSSTVQP